MFLHVKGSGCICAQCVRVLGLGEFNMVWANPIQERNAIARQCLRTYIFIAGIANKFNVLLVNKTEIITYAVRLLFFTSLPFVRATILTNW